MDPPVIGALLVGIVMAFIWPEPLKLLAGALVYAAIEAVYTLIGLALRGARAQKDVVGEALDIAFQRHRRNASSPLYVGVRALLGVLVGAFTTYGVRQLF